MGLSESFNFKEGEINMENQTNKKPNDITEGKNDIDEDTSN